MAKNPNQNEVIHGLSDGQTLCGLSLQARADWPAGHTWVSIDHVEVITCPGCQEILEPNEKD